MFFVCGGILFVCLVFFVVYCCLFCVLFCFRCLKLSGEFKVLRSLPRFRRLVGLISWSPGPNLVVLYWTTIKKHPFFFWCRSLQVSYPDFPDQGLCVFFGPHVFRGFSGSVLLLSVFLCIRMVAHDLQSCTSMIATKRIGQKCVLGSDGIATPIDKHTYPPTGVHYRCYGRPYRHCSAITATIEATAMTTTKAITTTAIATPLHDQLLVHLLDDNYYDRYSRTTTRTPSLDNSDDKYAHD